MLTQLAEADDKLQKAHLHAASLEANLNAAEVSGHGKAQDYILPIRHLFLR